jgi:hypothetical protein
VTCDRCSCSTTARLPLRAHHQFVFLREGDGYLAFGMAPKKSGTVWQQAVDALRLHERSNCTLRAACFSCAANVKVFCFPCRSLFFLHPHIFCAGLYRRRFSHICHARGLATRYCSNTLAPVDNRVACVDCGGFDLHGSARPGLAHPRSRTHGPCQLL